MTFSSRVIRTMVIGLAFNVCCAQVPDEGVPTFGVTVIARFGFCGRIYELPEGLIEPSASLNTTRDHPQSGQAKVKPISPPAGDSNIGCSTRLPKFERLQPVGFVYTTKLNVPPQDFRSGFAGVTKRFEWFAIDYSARFWVEKAGKYSFRLMSDDGSALYIDERRIIDNDCMHPPLIESGSVKLQGGIHDIRVSYFQGPRWQVALMLAIKVPGGDWKIFDTDDFRVPNAANADTPSDPCQIERRGRQLVPRQ